MIVRDSGSLILGVQEQERLEKILRKYLSCRVEELSGLTAIGIEEYAQDTDFIAKILLVLYRSVGMGREIKLVEVEDEEK